MFRPSADFARKLKLSSPLPDLPLPEIPLFDWCARPFRFGRYGFVLFTHTTTLFTLLTLQRGITTPKALRRAFAHAVNDYMTSPKRGSAQASALLAGLTDCQFARCTDRKVTGSINDQVWRAH